MKRESSEFDSFFNTELSDKQKAALENVLFNSDDIFGYKDSAAADTKLPNIPAAEPVQRPTGAPAPATAAAEPVRPVAEAPVRAFTETPVRPGEPQIVTIDMSRKTMVQNYGQPEHEPEEQPNLPFDYQANRRVRPGTRTSEPGRTGATGRNTGKRDPGRGINRSSISNNISRSIGRNIGTGSKGSRAKQSNLLRNVVLIALAIVLLGVWVRCMMGDSAPTANSVNKTILIGEPVVPTDFVVNVESEAGIVSIKFVDPPDVMEPQNQTVEIIITDENDKSSVFQATLIIQINNSPPVIEGTDTILSTRGNPIMYRQGVTAHDDFGRELELHVDSSGVNQNEIGVYTVMFWAVDLTGNKTEITEEVHILNVDIDYVFERVDTTLSEIINESMTQLEKIRLIHTWIRTNVSYASVIGGPADTVYEDAYRALRDRQGNCYVFYAIGEVLLTRAGIPNMPINRIPGTPTRHRWSLVNPDDLGWHHFDTTPTRLGLGIETAFFTNSQAKDFTARFIEFNGTQDFYTFNSELYPEITP
ncbi:MAG: transglutaminase-like domain-containing protein [Oscillospiraceae bacterium]|nr:transglutaminase-like domain-containing protein [Oscillospiraceae bacterium]